MQDFEKIILSGMMDIEGLEEISVWPLALGWWIVISTILLVTIYAAFLYYMKKKYEKTWKYQLILDLERISDELDEKNLKEKVGSLNEIIKRIVMQSYGRKETSSNEGIEWLKWLSSNDPKGFNWLKKGKILISCPYMPESDVKNIEKDILLIIKATKYWVK